jgi:CHAD domain-containing protein
MQNPNKMAASLNPSASSADSVRLVLIRLLDRIEQNVVGLINGGDPEFLHQFRVGVRRSRTILRQFREVFPSEIGDRFLSDFKWIGRVTGPSRDLDVFLDRLVGFEETGLDSIRLGLTPLHQLLLEKQSNERLRMVESISSDRFSTFVLNWRSFLQQPDEFKTASASPRVSEIFIGQVWLAYDDVLSRGSRIVEDPDAPAKTVHRLRIACKNLRYLIESFVADRNPTVVDPLLASLRQLQTSLGEAHDLELQLCKLQEFALKIVVSGSVDAETSLAFAQFEEHLKKQRQSEYDRFDEQFAQFIKQAKREKFEILIAR